MEAEVVEDVTHGRGAPAEDGMAEIVDLAARRATARPTQVDAPRGPARVLLFMGVRYERDGDDRRRDAPDRPGRAKSRRRRRPT
jgi:hypothetical protein